MKTHPLPFESDALRANIASTAQEIVIPPRYLPLLVAAEGFHGVRASLTETVSEYFHAYRSIDALVDGFQAILLRNWTYLERSPQRAHLFELLSELTLGVLDTPMSSDQFSLLLRGLLGWCRDVMNGQYTAEYDAALAKLGDGLLAFLPTRATAFLERDNLLRTVAERAAARPAVAPPFLELHRRVLVAGYHRLARHLDVPRWALEQQDGLTDASAVADGFAFLSGERLQALIQEAEAADGASLLAPGLPIVSELLGASLNQLSRTENLEDRFQIGRAHV